MRKYSFPLILIFAASLFSCKHGNKELAYHSITLMVLSSADSFSNSNRGYGIDFLSSINLDNDSVFQQKKFSNEDSTWKEIKLGAINRLSANDTFVKGLKALDNYPNGEIKDTEIPDGTLYCGQLFYLEYNLDDKTRFFLFRDYKLNSSIMNLVNLILKVDNNKTLDINSRIPFLKEDSLIDVIRLKNGINLITIPPRVKPDVIFVAP